MNSISKYPDSPETVVAFAKGLRELADLLEAHPEMGLPLNFNTYSNGPTFSFMVKGAAGLAAFARIVGNVTKTTDFSHFNLESKDKITGIRLTAFEKRSDVCTRVTRTRTVEKEVEVGTKVERVKEEVPVTFETVEREESVPIYETRQVEEEYEDWECPPSLLEEAAVAAV